MLRKTDIYIALVIFVVLSLVIKLFVIFKYGNYLTLSSDDINYIKSGIVLLEKKIFIYQNYNEPTVFITPLYPLFLAAVFKIAGYGYYGIQAVRVLQAVVSSIGIIYVFLISKRLMDGKTALLAAFLVSFYMPNITTAGYIMTETLFTTLLLMLLYLSLKFSDRPSISRFVVLGVVWAIVTLCRPTIALYPILYFTYLCFHLKFKLSKILMLGAAMFLSFAVIMMPWWVRNYIEYAEFIPLTASSGNPMLQGTYIDYKQTPDNIVCYKLGKNALETNRAELEAAKERIRSELERDFSGYLKWYIIGKTKILWNGIFYWKELLGITQYQVLAYHYVLLLGFAGMIMLLRDDFVKYMLPASVILYFNAVHCVYMAFDRYAFPVMPILSIFCASFIIKIFKILRMSQGRCM